MELLHFKKNDYGFRFFFEIDAKFELAVNGMLYAGFITSIFFIPYFFPTNSQ